MTFNVFFYPEQAFLGFVKRTIKKWEYENFQLGDDIDIEEIGQDIDDGAVAIIALVAAIEATVNSIFKYDGRFRQFDELRLESRLNLIYELNCASIEWGQQPWQDISRIIRIRNWLAHFKESNVIGLTSVDGDWIQDSVNRPPKIDPQYELSIAQVKNYYNSIRNGLIGISSLSEKYSQWRRIFEEERYDSILIG